MSNVFYQKPNGELPKEQKELTPKGKNSVMGILALILSLTGILFFIGAILAIIDLCQKNGRKKTISIIALVICAFWVLAIAGSDSDTSSDQPATAEVIETEIEETFEIIEEESELPTNEAPTMNYVVADPIFYTYDGTFETHYCFIQPIENTGNVPLYLKDCYIDFEDTNQHLLATEDFLSTCPDVIAPGETGYFYNSIGALSLDEQAINVDDIKLVPHIEVEEARRDPVDYIVSDTSLTKDNLGSPIIVGRVENNTTEDDSLLYINVIFYDAEGNIITITGTNVTDLYAGTTKSFECSSLYSAGEFDYNDIADYKVIARKMHMQF